MNNGDKNQGGVKGALTRKLGPFPAWVWIIALGALIYYIRNRSAGGASAAQAAAANQQPPQSPVVLQPGDTVYDPNTGTFLGTPSPPPSGRANNSLISLLMALLEGNKGGTKHRRPPTPHKHNHRRSRGHHDRHDRRHFHNVNHRGHRHHHHQGKPRGHK